MNVRSGCKVNAIAASAGGRLAGTKRIPRGRVSRTWFLAQCSPKRRNASVTYPSAVRGGADFGLRLRARLFGGPWPWPFSAAAGRWLARCRSDEGVAVGAPSQDIVGGTR